MRSRFVLLLAAGVVREGFRTAGRAVARAWAVERGGRWRDRFGRCAVCGRAAPIGDFEPFIVIGPDMPTLWRRWDNVLPCGHTVGEHWANADGLRDRIAIDG